MFPKDIKTIDIDPSLILAQNTALQLPRFYLPENALINGIIRPELVQEIINQSRLANPAEGRTNGYLVRPPACHFAEQRYCEATPSEATIIEANIWAISEPGISEIKITDTDPRGTYKRKIEYINSGRLVHLGEEYLTLKVRPGEVTTMGYANSLGINVICSAPIALLLKHEGLEHPYFPNPDEIGDVQSNIQNVFLLRAVDHEQLNRKFWE